MNGFLLDTNVLSELIKPRPLQKLVQWVESTDESLLCLSVLTFGEIRKGISALPRASRRAALDTWLEISLRRRFAGRILLIDEAVADRWGVIAGAATRPLPVIDGLLAATALHHNMTLVTRNTKDVTGTGASVMNPWED